MIKTEKFGMEYEGEMGGTNELNYFLK